MTNQEPLVEVDYLVIGGGVHGAATAFELAAAGKDVALIERHEIASGASGGPGMRGVRANGRDPRELPLMRLANRAWPLLDSVLSEKTGYQRIGGLELVDQITVGDERAWNAVLAQAQTQQAHGIDTQILDARGLQEMEPSISATPQAALYCPLDGVADHTATTRAFASAAARAGAAIHEHVEVAHLLHENAVTIAETVDGRRFRARVATVVLVNSYARSLLSRSFGLDLPIWRLAPQVSVVRPKDDFKMAHLIGHRTRNLAGKMLDPSSVMLSGGLRGYWDSKSDSGHIDEDVTARSWEDATAMFPGLADCELLVTDASRPESYSIDGIPIVDQVPGMPDIFFGTGWSGHGFAIAPAASAMLASWVRTGDRPDELEPFGLRRLGMN